MSQRVVAWPGGDTFKPSEVLAGGCEQRATHAHDHNNLMQTSLQSISVVFISNSTCCLESTIPCFAPQSFPQLDSAPSASLVMDSDCRQTVALLLLLPLTATACHGTFNTSVST